jgi:opacity protein-like surface antigen
MKKVLILSLALILGIGANAQIRFGVKAGLNLSSLSDIEASALGVTVKFEEREAMAVGFHAGGFVNFSFGQYIGLQPEVLFSMQGGRQKVSAALLSMVPAGAIPAGVNLSTDYSLSYINIPVLLDIKPFANFSILVGPQFGFNIYKSANDGSETLSGSEFEKSFESVFGENALNDFDFAVVGGLQYTFIEHLTIGVRYNFGLTNMCSTKLSDADVKGWKNNVIQISVGWAF